MGAWEIASIQRIALGDQAPVLLCQEGPIARIPRNVVARQRPPAPELSSPRRAQSGRRMLVVIATRKGAWLSHGAAGRRSWRDMGVALELGDELYIVQALSGG